MCIRDSIRIFAKIENQQGMEHLGELLPHCDEIVIARGDLGNAMPLAKLPCAQEEIADQCRKHGRAFMVVTQMLASMEHRAEVSDIFLSLIHILTEPQPPRRNSTAPFDDSILSGKCVGSLTAK